jgi:hypothetical protein
MLAENSLDGAGVVLDCAGNGGLGIGVVMIGLEQNAEHLVSEPEQYRYRSV